MFIFDLLFRLAAIGLLVLGLYVMVDGMKDMGEAIKYLTNDGQQTTYQRQPSRQDSPYQKAPSGTKGAGARNSTSQY